MFLLNYWQNFEWLFSVKIPILTFFFGKLKFLYILYSSWNLSKKNYFPAKSDLTLKAYYFWTIGQIFKHKKVKCSKFQALSIGSWYGSAKWAGSGSRSAFLKSRSNTLTRTNVMFLNGFFRTSQLCRKCGSSLAPRFLYK